MTKKGLFPEKQKSVLCRKRAFDANRRYARSGGLEAIQGKMKICQHLPNYTHKLWLSMLFWSIILYNDSLWLNLDRLPLCLCLHLCVVSIFFFSPQPAKAGQGLTFLPTGEFVSWPLSLRFVLALEEQLRGFSFDCEKALRVTPLDVI